MTTTGQTRNNNYWVEIFEAVFQTVLTTYLILLTLETVKTGFVSHFFNIEILLWAAVAAGSVMVLLKKEGQGNGGVKETGIEKKDWQYIWLLSSLGQLLVFYKTLHLGEMAVVLSLATFGAVATMNFLLLTYDRK